MFKNNYPEEPTDEAKVDSSLYDAELIGRVRNSSSSWTFWKYRFKCENSIPDRYASNGKQGS